MRSIACTIARTAQEIRDAQRVRFRVYVEEEQLLPAVAGTGEREIDARDDDATTLHFIVREGGEPVGTVRLLLPRAEGIGSGRLGLDLESKVDLGALAASGIAAAEVTRYCVLRRVRCTGVTTALFSALLAESLARGITHWVAGANMETDFAEDAAIASRVAIAKQLASTCWSAAPRVSEPPRTPRRRPCYTEAERLRAAAGDLTGVALPRTLALFAKRMGARFVGPPVYDAHFEVFALPLVATLAEIVGAEARAA